MVGITVAATLIALVFVLLSPKKYLSVVTALAANSLTADKARIFNNNIEALYSDFGTADELERLEGTAALDTIYIAASKALQLPAHYAMSGDDHAALKAAKRLKKNTRVTTSGFGELKVRVWDRDPSMAAGLANFLVDELHRIHQHLQSENNLLALKTIEDQYRQKQLQFIQWNDSLQQQATGTSSAVEGPPQSLVLRTRLAALAEQLQQYEKVIGQYQLAVSSPAAVILIVERARPSLHADRPRVVETLLWVFCSALICSFLLAVFFESGRSIR